jgi:opacity protein-like surface antigen
MKKLIIITTTLVALLATNNALAKTYIGAGLQSLDMSYKLNVSNYVNDSLKSGHIFVGHNLNNNVAIEIGYDKTKSAKKQNGADLTNVRFERVGIDTVLSHAINKRLDLIANAGVAYVYESGSGVIDGDNISVSESGVGAGVGAGVEFKLTDKISARTTAKFMKTNLEDVDSIVTYTADIKYSF